METKEIILKILDNQRHIQEVINKRNPNFTNIYRMTNLYVAAINGEIDEVNNEACYKWWKNNKTINMSNLQEEIADIFIIALDFIVRLKNYGKVELLLSEVLPNLKYKSSNVIDKIGYSEGIVYYTTKISNLVTGMTTLLDIDDYSQQLVKDRSIIAFTEFIFNVYSNILKLWVMLVVECGFKDTIINTILIKQEINIDRQLGKVEGKEKDYKISNNLLTADV